jgi:D-serine deaminase-like pyridoxal phosphate-dependent protein
MTTGERPTAPRHDGTTGPWFLIENVEDVASPALLVYPDRAEENIRRLIAVAGDVARLRPHMKTHKLPEIARLHVAHGIGKVKCATIAEAEMLADAGLSDILLAYQPVGPAVGRLLTLAARFPQVVFRAVVDDQGAARAIADAAVGAGQVIDLLVDLDVGMHRTGIEPELAMPLCRVLASLPGVSFGGLHAYDGHLRDRDLSSRRAQADAGFARVEALAAALEAEAVAVPRIVAGGTPTLPCHATRADARVELSPGTTVFWDAGYAEGLPDLDFLHAALVLTRVVSKPGGSRICLDLGHKAIASEMPHPRVVLLWPSRHRLEPAPRSFGAPVLDARFIGHSEEHLVLESPDAEHLAVGDVLYGIPWHVCPTVALHGTAIVVRNGRAVDRWRVTARERTLTV